MTAAATGAAARLSLALVVAAPTFTACSEHTGRGAAPPSCSRDGAGLTDCGESHESCCTSLTVPGGTYFRTYTSDPDGGAAIAQADPATVSSVRLDKYDVTVGRFRQFVSAWTHGWVPAAGAGKHVHLSGGLGLAAIAAPGAYEPGWVTADDSQVSPTSANLASCAPYSTWTDAPAAQENLPIDCINWWEAYAFCIWDDGFLPSEAEWEYAAAGGGAEREYPWGAADPGTASQYAVYGDGNGNCYYPSGTLAACTGVGNIAPVGRAARGAGLFGHLDLAGNMWQWNLDWHDPVYGSCADCTNTQASSSRVFRGGLFNYRRLYLEPPSRLYGPPDIRDLYVGVRCARSP